MTAFTSSREKRLWVASLSVFVLIFLTLFIGQPLEKLFQSQDVRAIVFLLVMVLVGAAILLHAVITKPTTVEIAVISGIAAVYIMFILRLGMPERSHLMEYSVLAILVHKAMAERVAQGKKISLPALISFVITFLLGVIDECLQLFIPSRVFDPVDILFNGMAAAMAIGSFILVQWIRKRIKNSKMKK